MKERYIVLKILIFLFAAIQIMGYVGNIGKKPTDAMGIFAIAYYIGFNAPLIIAVILFIIFSFLKKRQDKREENNLIDSIGKEEKLR